MDQRSSAAEFSPRLCGQFLVAARGRAAVKLFLLTKEEPHPELQKVIFGVMRIYMVPAFHSYAPTVTEPMVDTASKVKKVIGAAAKGQRIAAGHEWDCLPPGVKLINHAR